MTKDVRIGHPQRVGPLEVWPLSWNGMSERRYQGPPFTRELKIEEFDNGHGPRVGLISVENLTDRDFIIPSGWIVGAELLQVRSFNHAEVVPAREAILAEVSCVEKGRWSAGVNRVDAGRAPLSVLAAGWDYDLDERAWKINKESRQSRVWSQVSKQESRSGMRTTSSLEQIMREDAASDFNLMQFQSTLANALRMNRGQNGILIGFEGEPLLMEFYSSEEVAKSVIKETLTSLAFDLDHQEFIPLSKTQLEEFILESGIAELYMLSEREWAYLMASDSERIDTKATLDKEMRVINLTAINRSHRILMEV